MIVAAYSPSIVVFIATMGRVFGAGGTVFAVLVTIALAAAVITNIVHLYRRLTHGRPHPS
jgi:hypothetical protein